IIAELIGGMARSGLLGEHQIVNVLQFVFRIFKINNSHLFIFASTLLDKLKKLKNYQHYCNQLTDVPVLSEGATPTYSESAQQVDSNRNLIQNRANVTGEKKSKLNFEEK